MREFDFTSKTQAFPHQIDATEYIKGSKTAALFDEQGLGKSKVVIDAICQDIQSGQLNGALIVCKKSLLRMWENEIQTHSHLYSTTLAGNQYQRRRMFLTFSHFYLINYESLIQEKETITKLLKIRNLALILDESHKIKNPESNICRVIFEIKDLAKKRIIITGTPVANKPEDLWTQFYFLDNGQSLGDSFEEFKKRYGINISGTKSFIRRENLQKLQEIIGKVSIRRTKDKTFLELPEKVYYDLFVELKGKQKLMYDQLKKELYLEVVNMDGRTIEEDADNILKKLLRLTQIASNPSLIDKSYNEDPIKFQKLDGLLDEIIPRGEKAIVWSSFVDNIDFLKTRYKNYQALKIHGGVKIEDRNKAVNWFQHDPDYKVLVANPAAAREGLTLTASNNAIYVDRSFNLVDYLQSQDRIHRISQNKKCNIYKLVAKHTVDEYIENIMYKKHEVAKFIQGDIKNLNMEKSKLTKDEIIEMLGEEKS
jgi:SNF2 family DNA or RNA helicase